MKGVNYKDVSTPRHAWLFVASSDNWQVIVKRGSFGIRYRGILEEAQLGEPCVAYVPGPRQMLFVGLGKLTGGYQHVETAEYPHRVKLEVKLVKNGVPLKSIRSRLRFVKELTNLGLALRKGALKIPFSDYEVIEERLDSQLGLVGLKSHIQEGLEKPAESEGRELILIPIELIDTHTKAEGALLELGNCLGYETYVTVDDKNKELRSKLLAEIARLREIPNSIAPDIMGTVRHIDVIWFKDNHPSHCFEVEHSTNITQALVRFSELHGLHTRFTIVAPAEAQDKFDKEIERMLFRSIKDRVRFKSYDELAKFLAVAQEFAKEKRNFFGEHRVKEA